MAAKAKAAAKPRAKVRRGRKETPLEVAKAQIDGGEYDVAGHIRQGPRKARSNAAKAQDAERMKANAVERAKYNLDPEYQRATIDRKIVEYHVKTVTGVLDANRPATIKAAAVRLKLVSPQKMARMTKKADVYGLFNEAVKNGLKAREVREALAAAQEKPKSATKDTRVNDAEFGGKGEGPEHKTLKEYIHDVAAKVCKDTVEESEKEYSLLSGDKVDVTAWNTKTIWHIEVKSHISKDPDVKRGIYQCIKYAAVGKAMEKDENSGRRVKSLLVVESKPSEYVSALAKKLDVRVYRLPAPMRRELNELRAANG